MYEFNRLKNECEVVLCGHAELNPHWICEQYNKWSNKPTSEWTVGDFVESFYAVNEEWDDHVMAINGRIITFITNTPYNPDYDRLREQGIFGDDLLMYDVDTEEFLGAIIEDGTLIPTEWCNEKYEWETEEV
jgi:hypothetical protein